MTSQHQPVLLDEVIELTRGTPIPLRQGFDGTFGRGGHVRSLLEAFPELRILAVDEDAEAIQFGKENFADAIGSERLVLVQGNFASPPPPWPGGWNLILLDLGVSSPQLDVPERGFSFYHDGPLDMRMGESTSLTAESIVNDWSERQLLELFSEYGEVARPAKVVRAICGARRVGRITRTLQLAELIERAEGWRKRGHHPATQFFLALRMCVNSELENIREGLPQLLEALSPGGRFLVITFHSLEDRLVKRVFREAADRGFGRRVNKKVIIPERDECRRNPRARSAKLRVFERSLS